MNATDAPRHLLVVSPHARTGENGCIDALYTQSLKALLMRDGRWTVDAVDLFHPAFPDAVLSSELVLVQMLSDPIIETVIRRRRRLGLATVYELDDFHAGWLTANSLLRSPLVRQNLLYHASIADALQMAARGQEPRFASVNPRITAFDPWVPLPDSRPSKPAGFTFGWGGTRSHEEDLADVAPAIVEFCRRHPDVTFSCMGDLAMCTRHFDAIPRNQLRTRAFGRYEEFLDFAGTLHVGLAPLRDNAFNVGRGDTKFAAYAAGGAAPVLADVPAYRQHRERSRLFGSPDELLEILESLRGDAVGLADVAARAERWVRRERSAEALAAQRDRFYRPLLPAQRLPRPELAPDSRRLGARLVESLSHSPDDALRLAREMVIEAPEYAQAHMCVVERLERAGRQEEALAAAHAAPVHDLYRDHFAEAKARLAKRLRPQDVPRHLEEIESPVRQLRLQHDDAVDRLSYFRAVLEAQPYDYFALRSVIGSAATGSAERSPLEERLALIA